MASHEHDELLDSGSAYLASLRAAKRHGARLIRYKAAPGTMHAHSRNALHRAGQKKLHKGAYNDLLIFQLPHRNSVDIPRLAAQNRSSQAVTTDRLDYGRHSSASHVATYARMHDALLNLKD